MKFGLVWILFPLSAIAQEVPRDLFNQIQNLDRYMQDNNDSISTVLHDDILFGHSNGWVQNKTDFSNDFKSSKVSYSRLTNIKINSFKRYNKLVLINREILVEGKYKDFPFKMTLLSSENWIRSSGKWLLWHRQSVELKP